jgi:hypothetical protein
MSTEPELDKVMQERIAHSEGNDCSVIALSIVIGVPYNVAHDVLCAAGRRQGRGFQMSGWLSEQANLGGIICGYKFTQVRTCTVDYKYAGYKYKTVAQVRRDFPKGRFFLSVNHHIFAMIDGKLLDGSDTGMRSRVLRLTLAERA